MPNLGFTICHLASFFPLGDVTIYAKTTVTRPRNIKVTPMHEKLTVTVSKGKEAGILEAFSYIQIGSMILQISPPQDEVKPNFRTPPKKL